VAIVTVVPVINIFRLTSSVFSADCTATSVCWVIRGLVKWPPGTARGPSADTMGRAWSMKLITG
jgi:hypothetical protein